MQTGKLQPLAVTLAVVMAAVILVGPAGVMAEPKLAVPRLSQTQQAPAPGATQPGATQPGATQPAEAKPEEPKGPNTGRVSFSGGIDFPTDYYFRGIFQEDENYIIQPYGELGFKLWDSKDGPLNNVTFSLGTWNSLDGGPSGVDGSASQDPKIWYESDFIVKLMTTWFEDFTAGLIYTAYMSPNDRFNTVQELALSLSYNDAKFLGPFALNPALLFGFEMKGQADAGAHKGVYMQIGLTPGLTLLEKSQYPISLTFPILFGLSLSDYYEFGTGNDDTFGYFQGGVAASVPLKFIPPDFGAWQIRGSFNWLYLAGDNLKNVNHNDRNEYIFSIGLAFQY